MIVLMLEKLGQFITNEADIFSLKDFFRQKIIYAK